MALSRRYEIRLLDRVLVEFTISDGPFSSVVALDAAMEQRPYANDGVLRPRLSES